MPIKPKPYKQKCPKCGYTKVVRPQSDTDMITSFLCPKCSTPMERVKMNRLDDVMGVFFR